MFDLEEEFLTGHVDNSLNIPLADLPSHFNKLKDKHQHIILCCKSGMRTRAAEILMSSKGYVNIVNGGSWLIMASKRKIRKNLDILDEILNILIDRVQYLKSNYVINNVNTFHSYCSFLVKQNLFIYLKRFLF